MQPTSPEYFVNAAILQYAVRCWTAHDLEALEKLGLLGDKLKLILGMSQEGVSEFADSEEPLFEIRVNDAVFSRVFRATEERRRLDAVFTKLIAARAPWTLIRMLYRVNERQFARVRRALDVRSRGRTRQPSSEEQISIWEVWRELRQRNPPPDFGPREFLVLHRRTGVPLDVIWTAVRNDCKCA